MGARAVGVLAAVWVGSTPALAQEQPTPAPTAPTFPQPVPGYRQPPLGWQPPPPGVVPVILAGDRPGLRFTLARDKDQPPFAYCPYDCTLALAPGEYWLTVLATPETVEGARRIEIEGPSHARVEPRTEASRSSGKSMGYIGIGLLAGGFVATLVGINQGVRGEEDNAVLLVLLGLGGIATGAVLTPIGFVRGGRSAPRVEIERLDRSRR